MAIQRIAQFCRECIESATARGGYWIGSMLLMLTGGFMLVETQAFSESSTQWLSIGAAVLAIGISAVLFYFGYRRERAEMLVPPFLGALVAGWAVFATSGVYSDFTAKWHAFAAGGALLVLGLVAQGLHEARTERVVHSLQVGEEPRERVEAVAEQAPEREPVGR